MTGTMFYPNWKEKVVYPAEGAEPQVLEENEKFKMVFNSKSCRGNRVH